MRRTLLASLVVLCAAMLVGAAILLRPAHTRSPAAGPAGAARHAGTNAAGAAGVAAERDDDDADPQSASTPARRRAALRAAPVWTVDKAASRLSFRAVMDGAPFDGVFRDWDAQIAFDPKTLASSHATITVNTASALTGQPIKDQALPNSEWLATDSFPQATLVTRAITQTSPGHFQAVAEVRIRGVSWRTTIPFVVTLNHDAGRMDATMTLDRRTFGIGEGPFRSPAPVEPSVQVIMKLAAKRSR